MRTSAAFRRGHLAVLVVLLLYGRAHASQDTLELTQMDGTKWYGTNGEPYRKGVYCENALGLPSSKPIDAICNNRNPTLFSGSAADMFMAARFGGNLSYGAGFWNSNSSSTPYTTDPNTPWMLADYVLTVSKTQGRVDSWKNISTKAQVDLLLCSDPQCTYMGDLQSVIPEDGSMMNATLAMGLTIFRARRWAGLQLNFPQGNIREGVQSFSETKSMLGDQVVGYKTLAKEGLNIQQVHWSNKNLAWSPERFSVQQMPSLGLLTKMLAAKNHHHALLPRFGLYKATVLMRDQESDLEAQRRNAGLPIIREGREECVLIIYPSHPQLDAAGWNVSDPDCYGTSSKGDAFSRVQAGYVLDSWVPQARFLGPERSHLTDSDLLRGTLLSGESDTLWDQELMQRSSIMGPSNVHNDTWIWQHMLKLSTDLAAPIDITELKSKQFGDLGGRYGFTWSCTRGVEENKDFKNDNPWDGCSPMTQLEAECVAKVENTPDGSASAKGNCTVLQVGAATVAARRFNWANDIPRRLFQAQFIGRRPGGLPDAKDLPWCWDRGAPCDTSWCGAPRGFIVAELENVTGLKGSIRASGNCSLWSRLGLDRVHLKGSEPGPSAWHMHELLNVEWLNLTSTESGPVPLARASGPVPFPRDSPEGWGFWSMDGYNDTVLDLMKAAYQATDRISSQELTTVDATKTLSGAVLDSTVVLVAIFAMAAGYKDMLSFAVRIQCKVFRKPVPDPMASAPLYILMPAKLTTTAIIALALVVSPIITLLSEQAAHEGNPKGDSSKVGWLSVPTRVGFGPYVVVAAVSMSTRAYYDEAAYSIVIVNLVVACVAAVWLSALLWREELRPCLAQMIRLHKFMARQFKQLQTVLAGWCT